MKMNNKIFWIIVVLMIAGRSLAANNSYVILSPKTFRPGLEANINVLILREYPPGNPVNVEATFLINSIPIASASGQFRAGSLGSLQLAIPFQGFPHDSHRYNIKKELRVAGSGGLTFNTTTLSTTSDDVFFDMKGFSVYVQTDKGVYKPSQTVHIRILAVYPDLQVHKSKMTIGITDPKNNKLALWKDLMAPSGVITRDFELSSQPNLGTWKITVAVDGRTEAKTFDVREYVLPKFKVDVLTNSYAVRRNGAIRGFVSAKYTYGKGVKGMAKLWLQFPCFAYLRSKCNRPSLKEFKLDGNHSFHISEEEIREIYKREYGRNFAYKWHSLATVNVSVMEDLTGKTYFGTTRVALRRTDVDLTFPPANNPNSFKPNIRFQILLRATRPDKTPLVNQTISVRKSQGNLRNENGNKWTQYFTDSDGYVALHLNVSDENIKRVRIDAETVGENGERQSRRKFISRFQSSSRTYLQLKVEQYTVQAGEDIVLKMTTTKAISTLNYLIISKGNIIKGDSISYAPNVTSSTLRIPSKRNMSPSANIVVYFVREDREIIADSLKIVVNGPFENMVSVKFGSKQTKPGEAVSINVQASPFSQVGLLAVDKSVLLLDEGNDFSVSQVMKDLESYNKNSGGYFPIWRGRRKRSLFFPWFPLGKDAHEIFQNAGVLVMTDILDFGRIQPLFWTKSHTFSRFDSMRRGRKLNKKPSNLADVNKVRSFFPETWLWTDINTDSSGHAQVQSKSPDTITSWVLSGFAVSNETGFGVANEKPQLRVFQPFFLSMDLPYSVIRGEQVAIKVIVFNYENEDMKVYVTLKESSDWKSINKSSEITNTIANGISEDAVSVITVSANSGATVSFPIIPTKLGNIPVEISAQSTTSADAVRRILLVEPEGIEQDYSYSLLLDMKLATQFRQELKLSLPSDMVKGSAKAMVSVIGDILGSSISGIENLLRMPYGCGEQNMINFAPSMFIRAYLEIVSQLTPSIKEKSLRFMTLGYQRELTYQHADGSYSAFGNKYGIPRPGSLWLTAFVVKSFSRAMSYIYIDGKSLNKSVEFILSTQQKDGSFKETGSVSSYLQGGLKSRNPAALTAYVTVSLLEYGNKYKNAQEGIDKALKYLQATLNHTKDSYTLALTAYAMELADHPSKEFVLSKLLAKSMREDGTLYWKEDRNGEEKQKRPWFRPYYRPKSADIEITSYALLVFALRRDTKNGLAIARWLAQQRNSFGGYSSTQDTVIGLQALSEFAPLVFSEDIDFTAKISTTGFTKSFKVDKSNLIVLQRVELPTVEGTILVTGNGKGIGMLQIGVTYNVDKPPTDKSFKLVVKVLTAEKNKLQAQSCVNFEGAGKNSGMAILEFGLPSGFSVDRDDIEKLISENPNIKRIENPGRKSVFYFDEISKNRSLCVNITSLRTHAVGKPQAIPVVVYDYYKPEQRAVVMYSASEGLDLCDVCSDCVGCKDGKMCNETSDCSGPTDQPRDVGSASSRGMSLLLVIITELFLMLHFEC